MNPTSATAPNSAGGICLCMIVKDEQDVIERCLRSVRPFISSWCIVDTGSSDRTRELIRAALADLPGQLYDREWVNFSHNRNQAWELALENKPEYLMFLDADEELVIDGGLPKLDMDAYLISVWYNSSLENRFWMVKHDYPNRWVGEIHEDIPGFGQIGKIIGTLIVSHPDGARAKTPLARSLSDIKVLQGLIDKTPEDPRLWYYLGATYIAAGDHESALKAFTKRATMGGNERELMKAQAFVNSYAAQHQEVSA